MPSRKKDTREPTEMTGTLSGAKNNSLINSMRRDYNRIKESIILEIIMNYVGKTILFEI